MQEAAEFSKNANQVFYGQTNKVSIDYENLSKQISIKHNELIKCNNITVIVLIYAIKNKNK